MRKIVSLHVSKSIFNVTLADKANVQSKPYGHSAYCKATLPAGTTVSVTGTAKNHYGNTWYQMADATGSAATDAKPSRRKPLTRSRR